MSASATYDFLDANSLIRYLAADHPEHSKRAKALIEGEGRFRVSAVTLIEVAYVLMKILGVPREDVVDALTALIERDNIETHEFDTETAVTALALCRPSGRVSLADAMLWAIARSHSSSRVWTFDRRFPKEGVQVRHP